MGEGEEAASTTRSSRTMKAINSMCTISSNFHLVDYRSKIGAGEYVPDSWASRSYHKD